MKLALKKLLQAHPSIQVSTLLSGSLTTPSAKGAFVPPIESYESIATVTLSSSQATISFTSIPATYKHLQIRSLSRNTGAGTAYSDIKMLFNSDTGANYSIHYVDGTGASVTQAGVGTRSDPRGGLSVDGGTTASIFGANVTDILDYSNTNKYKTTRTIGGVDINGAGGGSRLESGVWTNTAAITRIDFTDLSGSNFAQYSSFALYGIEGA